MQGSADGSCKGEAGSILGPGTTWAAQLRCCSGPGADAATPARLVGNWVLPARSLESTMCTVGAR